MSRVGLIANPASGKDIRRLVSHATVISNTEKTDILKRVILGLDSTGVEEILLMPDDCGLGLRAIDTLKHFSISAKITLLDFEIQGTQDDSIRAARIMGDEKVDCIITLGGDGTNRVVSKGCGQIPLIPISTGTNNVFSVLCEGTTAGIAAGILARKIVDEAKTVRATKKISVLSKHGEEDLALVDAVLVDDPFIRARALWEEQKIRHVFLTQAEPGSIGICSLGSALCPVKRNDQFGLMIELGAGGDKVRAPIAPGLVRDVEVKSFRIWRFKEKISLPSCFATIALDGEREVEINHGDQYHLVLSENGPRVVNVPEVLREGTKAGFFWVRKEP
jgi:predicted polyphosphate/ATP-dependent NAD kinase